MSKSQYYVTVGTGEVLPERTLSEWEYEINATKDEVFQLQTMFEEADSASWSTFWHGHIPFKSIIHDESIDKYDNDLIGIYRLLYKLGTSETKTHIKSMGIIAEEELDGIND